jgi:translation initiation factor IF-2
LDLSSSDLLNIISHKNELQALNVVVKADVQGSLQSVLASLKALGSEEVAVNVIGSGIGPINENDLNLAHSNNTIIYGFNVSAPTNVKRLAARDKIIVQYYQVIYELIEDARAELSKLLVPEVVETSTGRLQVKAVFKTTRSEIICGGEVTKGKLVAPAFTKITRGGEELGEAEVTNLKRGPQDTGEVQEGEMCGVNLKTASKLLLQEGDRLEVFTRETRERNL